MYAPVCIFAYKRRDHLEQTVNSLERNEQSKDTDLVIFSDAPKSDKDTPYVKEVRAYIKKISGFKSIEIIEREQNFGLSKNIIVGLNFIFSRYNRAIVLEDDTPVSSYFLDYMNRSLEKYKTNTDVISIHGYTYPVKKKLPETFFLKGADCWGWGTWKRGWELFESDGSKLLTELKVKNLTAEFDFYGSYPYTKMLEDQTSGQIDSWAIRWYASAFLQNKLTLYPGISLIQNIGHDSSGTNCDTNIKFKVKINNNKITTWPSIVAEEKLAKEAFKDYFHSLKPNKIKKIKNTLVGFFK